MVNIKNQSEEKIGTGVGLEKSAGLGPERVISVEKKTEIEKPPMPAKVERMQPAKAVEVEKPMVTTVVAPITVSPPKSATLVKIEKILEEDLEEFYFSMPPDKQKEFKAKGEEAASKIEKMIEGGRAVGRKILNLIRDWLKLIPGVNKFFLEQEAKIKTDKVVAMAERKKME